MATKAKAKAKPKTQVDKFISIVAGSDWSSIPELIVACDEAENFWTDEFYRTSERNAKSRSNSKPDEEG